MTHPTLDPTGLWLGRINLPAIGPAIVTLRDGQLIDITSQTAPTVRDILERDDAADYVRNAPGKTIGALEGEDYDWLAPCDFQAVKACGVTFAGSMVERVIEEQAAGDPDKAESIRARIGERIGDSLANIIPGSDEAETVKQALIQEGLWSQ